MTTGVAVALVLGLMVVLALSLAAYYAYKTRSKIWRHGKHNVHWDRPLVRTSEGQDVQDWVNHVGEGRSTQHAPTVVLSERAAPDLRGGKIAVTHGNGTLSVYSDAGAFLSSNNTNSRGPEPLYQNVGAAVSTKSSASERVEEEAASDSIRKPPQYEERGRGPEHGAGSPSAGDAVESQLYPEITSEDQRRRYKGEFVADLARYKRLCAEMDDTSDQIHKLGRELDTLPEGSVKYQSPHYQGKKKDTKELRQKLSHIKRLVKNFDLHV
ncbi:hypothetical protein CRUP_008639 [Coryphaenoides rupestris]|nr:hypothetical protein CRUP_008639 [Coryphaenoides rupestris]